MKIASLDRVLGFGARAATMCTIRMTREINRFTGRQLENLLKLATNVHQDILALLRRSSLATGNIAISATGNALADCASPDTDTVKALADVDNDTHELSVIFLLEGLANGRKHDVEPELIDRDVALLLELIGPLSAVLVLLILPFWPNAFLEEVVVGFKSEFGGGSDVVLQGIDVSGGIKIGGANIYIRRRPRIPQQS